MGRRAKPELRPCLPENLRGKLRWTGRCRIYRGTNKTMLENCLGLMTVAASIGNMRG